MDIDKEEELAWIDHIMNTIKQLYTNTGKINEVDADGYRNIDFSEFLTLMNTMMKDMDNQEGPAKVDRSLTNNIDFPEFPILMAREMKDTDTNEELVDAFKVQHLHKQCHRNAEDPRHV